MLRDWPAVFFRSFRFEWLGPAFLADRDERGVRAF
jgi:hypothetical protein